MTWPYVATALVLAAKLFWDLFGGPPFSGAAA